MSANLNYWTAPHNSDNGFPDSDGRKDERREIGWLSGTELRYRALSHVKSFYWMCRRGTRPPLRYSPSFRAFAALDPFHYRTYTFPDIHTHTQPLANSLKRVTFVHQLPVKRGEHCLWVNKVKVTDQVNFKKARILLPENIFINTQHVPCCQKWQFWNLITDRMTTSKKKWFFVFIPNTPDSHLN